jgi:glutaryl-CoA dehydrogenase
MVLQMESDRDLQPDLQFSIGEALGTDYFLLREPFTPQQEGYLTRTREFVDTEVLPVINDYWERAEFPWALGHC